MKNYVTKPVRDWMDTAWYRSNICILPDVLIGRWPDDIAAPFRYHTWVVETSLEEQNLERLLKQPVPSCGHVLDVENGPDSAVSKTSKYSPAVPIYCLYAPADDGWPWLVNVLWPDCLMALVPATCTRSRYSHEFFATRKAAVEFLEFWSGLVPQAQMISLEPSVKGE